jgi:hypothetical protein
MQLVGIMIYRHITIIILEINQNYQKFELYVKEFKKRIFWDNTAEQHLQIQLQLQT